MADTARNRLKCSISNAPGSSGALTIADTFAGYRKFASTDDGLSFSCLFQDGTSWEVRTGCTYTHSTTSLSRGTLEDSSTGSAITLGVSTIVANVQTGAQTASLLSLVSGAWNPRTRARTATRNRYQAAAAATFTIGSTNGVGWENCLLFPAGAVSSTNASSLSVASCNELTGSFARSTWTFVNSQAQSSAYTRHWARYACPTPVRFRLDGRYLLLLISGATGGKLAVYADDVNVTPGLVYSRPNTGNNSDFLLIDLGNWGRRRIRLILDNSMGLCAVGTTDTNGIITADPTRELTAWVMADSYGGFGCTQQPMLLGLMRNAMNRAGITEQVIDQVGGTGYLIGGASNALTRLALAITNQPDVLVTAMGINDTSGAPTQAAILSYYTQARAGLPNALLIAFEPWCPNESGAYTVGGVPQLLCSYILAALRAVGGPWILIGNINGKLIVNADSEQTILQTTGTAWQGEAIGTSWQTGNGRVFFLTGSITAATSATLLSGWTGSTASNYKIRFSDGTVKTNVTLTAGSQSISWSGAVTATSQIQAYQTDGNGGRYIDPDGTHPYYTEGCDYLESMMGEYISAALARL